MCPIYEYQCKKCQNIMEVTHKIADNPKISCLKCGYKTVKVMSTGGFRLFGEGFYNRSKKDD